MTTCALVPTACQVYAEAPLQPWDELTGTLESGWLGIGGEHTGWILRRDGDSDAAPVEVDVACCKTVAAELDGVRVMIFGRWTDKQYVERGSVRIFVADRISPAAE